MKIYRMSNKKEIEADIKKLLSDAFIKLDSKLKGIYQANKRSFVLKDMILAEIDGYKLKANYVLQMVDLLDPNGKKIESFFRM